MNIQIVFLPFKIGNLFSPKDPLPDNLRSYVVYKYICPGCNACYVGETKRHLPIRIKEHLVSDKNSQIFKHLACRGRWGNLGRILMIF